MNRAETGNDGARDAPGCGGKAAAPFGAALLFFFVSGACGLLYQVVWTRKLVLLFGTTSYAVSTVLSIFFLGLALGSLWGGRMADRSRRPLLVYGVLEILVGLWALLFILAIDAGEGAVVSVLRFFGPTRGLGVALRALLAMAFLLVPVTLMGATLPLLARFVTLRGPPRGGRIGALYSLNTLGAVAGCAATGFFLLANLGYTRTTLVGAALNVGVGLLAVALGLRGRRAGAEAPEPVAGAESGPARSVAAFLVVAAFGLSGFCSLALEVLWTRLLAIVFLGTTYAFTTVLTTVLCGIALGSAAASALIDRRRHRVALFGAIQVLTGAACLFMLALFPLLPEKLAEMRVQAGFEWRHVVLAKFWLSFLVLFLPTFLFGMSFPVAVKAAALDHKNLGRGVGRLYAANTLGGVLGALAGGFLLIPVLGTHRGILLLSLLLGLMGLALVSVCPTLPKKGKGLLATASAAVMLLAALLLPGDVSRSINEGIIPDDHRMVYYREGVEGTVVVSAPREETHGTDRVLWINAVQATASIEKGVKMNRFQGVLPLLFDRHPKNALFMCFGSGITAGTLALFPFERIDAVEISRDVLDAARLFKEDNFDVTENPRVHFIVDDGRNFLLTTPERYDVITFEPMPLALAGVSTFYTREYYELCLDRLQPGGIVSQWVPLHGLNEDLVRSLTKTFIDVFPETSAWFINAELFLIGSNQPLRIDYTLAQTRIMENDVLRSGLEEVYLRDLPELLACHFMGKEGLARYARDGDLLSDDRPWAEFAAPKLVYERAVAEALDILAPYREPATALLVPEDRESWAATVEAVERRHRAHVQDMEGLKLYYSGGFGSRPEDEFRKSLAIDPNDYNAQYYLAEVLFAKGQLSTRWDEPEDAIGLLLEARRYAPHRADILLALGDAYHAAQRAQDAQNAYRDYQTLGGHASRSYGN